MERLPYRATEAAAAYEGIQPLPVCVLLENVRSLYNVGAFFRTADGVALEKLYLAGITGYPPQNMIGKTALGAESPPERVVTLPAANRRRGANGCGWEAVDRSRRSGRRGAAWPEDVRLRRPAGRGLPDR